MSDSRSRTTAFLLSLARDVHTELDIELVCLLTGRVLGRPWLTIMTDAFSRRFLGFYLTFDPPSYRSCMMVIREPSRSRAIVRLAAADLS